MCKFMTFVVLQSSDRVNCF